jgi:class 3 adenylate cyclase
VVADRPTAYASAVQPEMGEPPGPPTVSGGADERRQVTVLFADLVGSTERASTLDPEDWHEILDAYQHRVAKVVTEHAGVVTQFQGDGVVCYFGYPQATETAATDALDAGLGIVVAVRDLTDTIPAELGVGSLEARVAVHTGVVVVAAADAGGVLRPADIFGEVPNLAARLQGEAAPGEVLASAATASLVAGLFEMDTLPPLQLKGFSHPAVAHRVLRRTGARSRLERGPLVAFIPRTAEWEWLETQWETARSGGTRTVVVSGEAGIGKSRLLLEFAGAVGSRGGQALTVYCNRADRLSPLQPFGTLMGSVPPRPEAAVSWILTQAGRGPTLLVVDDAHWADPSTLEVVDRLAATGATLLCALTARPEFSGHWAGATAGAHLVLDRLDVGDARALIDRVGGGPDLPRAVVDELVQRADGVPLYLEELTRSLRQQGDNYSVPIPATLHEVITARLDRLGEGKRVAQLAAVIGREFDATVLAQVAGIPSARLNAHLARLQEQAIVHQPERSGALWFRHALIHEAAYSSLIRQDRRTTHSRVADALLASGAAGAQPQVVASHLGAAGRSQEASDLWRRAASLARRHSRYREAAGHEREILQLLPGLAEEARPQVEMEARSRLAMSLATFDQRSEEALEEALAAQALARRAGDDRGVLQTYMVLIPGWQAQADYAAIDAALVDASHLARRLGDPWSESAVALLQAAIPAWRGRVTDALAGLTDALAASGMALSQTMRSLPRLNAPTALLRASVRIATALCLWLSGDATGAWWLADDALEFAADRRVLPARAVVAATAAVIAQLDGDRARAAELAEVALRLPDDVATLQWRRWAAVIRWWATEEGDHPEVPGPMLRPYFLTLVADKTADPGRAVGLLDDALEAARATGELFCEAEILRGRSRAHLRAGHRAPARADLESATEVARRQGARSLELRSLTDRLSLPGEGAAAPRLAELVAQLGERGPRHHLRAAARLLGDL